jgi:hypothetical protein
MPCHALRLPHERLRRQWHGRAGRAGGWSSALPVGSTPERPEGTVEVPPEETPLNLAF